MVATLHLLALAVTLQVHAQVLALQDGFLLLTSGDALRVARDLDAAVERQATPGRYVLISLDDRGVVRALRVSDQPFTAGVAPSEVPPALFATPPHPRGAAGAGEARVNVTLDVSVPASTPPGDAVYVATAASGWNANQVRCSQRNGVNWSCTLELPADASLVYRYTRGSWSTAESDPAGGQAPARTLRARAGEIVHDTVPRWSDQR